MRLLAPPAPAHPHHRDAAGAGPGPTNLAEPQVLFPFAGPFDPGTLEIAVELANCGGATLAAVYLTVVPLRHHESSPAHEPSWLAAPLLEVVERAALDQGVTVSTRIGTGRTLKHALRRLLAAERFDRIVAPAPALGMRGFAEKDIAWLVAHAPVPTLVFMPGDPAPWAGAGTPDAANSRPSTAATWAGIVAAGLGTGPAA